MPRHFLKETDFTYDEAVRVFQLAAELKAARASTPKTLGGQSWGLLFYKSSTRTRVSFEVGVYELGAHPLILSAQNTQLGRGETVADSARVLSRYLHGLVIRTFGHNIVEEFAAAGTIPIVNALTDFLHPCQIYADLFTLIERWGNGTSHPDCLRGRKIAFLGDTACNMANSWILGAALFGLELRLAGPAGYEPGPEIRALLAAEDLEPTFHYTTDPAEAVAGADMVYTDVWVSMGMEAESQERLAAMRPFQVNSELMARTAPDACFMHCLPAHADEEVTAAVLESPASIVFDQAENRLHAQKAILAELVRLSGN